MKWVNFSSEVLRAAVQDKENEKKNIKCFFYRNNIV